MLEFSINGILYFSINRINILNNRERVNKSFSRVPNLAETVEIGRRDKFLVPGWAGKQDQATQENVAIL